MTAPSGQGRIRFAVRRSAAPIRFWTPDRARASSNSSFPADRPMTAARTTDHPRCFSDITVQLTRSGPVMRGPAERHPGRPVLIGRQASRQLAETGPWADDPSPRVPITLTDKDCLYPDGADRQATRRGRVKRTRWAGRLPPPIPSVVCAKRMELQSRSERSGVRSRAMTPARSISCRLTRRVPGLGRAAWSDHLRMSGFGCPVARRRRSRLRWHDCRTLVVVSR